MTLWKIEPIEVWRKLQGEGVLRARLEHVDADFRSAYEWLRPQMTAHRATTRTGCLSDVGLLPVEWR